MSGVNVKEMVWSSDDVAVVVPVRRRIKYWWVGGPWNHHSRSGARMWCTVSTSRVCRALYRALTTLWLIRLLGPSRVSLELASSREKERERCESYGG